MQWSEGEWGSGDLAMTSLITDFVVRRNSMKFSRKNFDHFSAGFSFK